MSTPLRADQRTTARPSQGPKNKLPKEIDSPSRSMLSAYVPASWPHSLYTYKYKATIAPVKLYSVSAPDGPSTRDIIHTTLQTGQRETSLLVSICLWFICLQSVQGTQTLQEEPLLASLFLLFVNPLIFTPAAVKRACLQALELQSKLGSYLLQSRLCALLFLREHVPDNICNYEEHNRNLRRDASINKGVSKLLTADTQHTCKECCVYRKQKLHSQVHHNNQVWRASLSTTECEKIHE